MADPKSYAGSCFCGAVQPGMGPTDVDAVVIPDFSYRAGVPMNYLETALSIPTVSRSPRTFRRNSVAQARRWRPELRSERLP